ncbi:MAG: DUF58 domain-containing protein [Planctomycetota bacterium]|jgi:uncharacterized protein (DUF58 family)
MIVPGRPALFIALLLAILLTGVMVVPALLWGVLLLNAGLLAFILVEGRRLGSTTVTVKRQGNRKFQIGRPLELTFTLDNRSDQRLRMRIRQRWPQGVEAIDREAEVELAPHEEVTLALTATPHRRGCFVLPPSEIDLTSKTGCAIRRWNVEDEPAFAVYPDLQALYDFETLRRSRALQRIGLHRQRQVGSGREFEQLREYNPDDDYRDINWKATARKQIPITNIYQAERSQDLLLCLDCGRMMGNPMGSGTALDAAIDASIMLAHAANRQSDQVGLARFTDSVDLLLKPKAGSSATHRLIEELVEVQASSLFPSYAALVETLRTSHKRRSLIFLFTDLNDPQLAADLEAVIQLISRRHLIVVVSLRDPLLNRIAESGAKKREDLFRSMAARELVGEREARMGDLRRHGVQVLEADAGSISMAVLNRYLEIKSRQML